MYIEFIEDRGKNYFFYLLFIFYLFFKLLNISCARPNGSTVRHINSGPTFLLDMLFFNLNVLILTCMIRFYIQVSILQFERIVVQSILIDN